LGIEREIAMFDAPHFQDHDEARKYLEALRWAGEPVCAHCGTIGGHYATKKTGVWRCSAKGCRKDFSVTTKTVMESSHIKLHIWLQAFALMTASKKGISAHQLYRSLKVTYKSAWFLCHRIREAMRTGGLTPMGGEGKIVEADETYFGEIDEARVSKQRQDRPYKRRKHVGTKRAIVSLVERGGSVRSFHVPVADAATVANIVNENIARETRLHTDESRLYTKVGAEFAAHETVNHSAKEYARGDVTTNSVEGYFSIFKRGMKGVYQHCDEKHLHRYLAEFDFRYNNRAALGVTDGERADIAIKGIEGKRLTYRLPY
jgi:transposase-like protein